jgi:hypothetical protein
MGVKKVAGEFRVNERGRLCLTPTRALHEKLMEEKESGGFNSVTELVEYLLNEYATNKESAKRVEKLLWEVKEEQTKLRRLLAETFNFSNLFISPLTQEQQREIVIGLQSLIDYGKNASLREKLLKENMRI